MTTPITYFKVGGKALCVEGEGYDSFTVGLTYEIVSKDEGMVRLIDNDGEDVWVPNMFFIEDFIPYYGEQANVQASHHLQA